MKKNLILIIIFTITFAITNCGKSTQPRKPREIKSAEDIKAISLFNSNGCKACHSVTKGISKKPYPSLPHMASRTDKDFNDCVLKGVDGTQMKPQKISQEEVKLIRNWLVKYY